MFGPTSPAKEEGMRIGRMAQTPSGSVQAGQAKRPPALGLMRCWRVMQTMTRDEPKDKAHHEHHGIQSVRSL